MPILGAMKSTGFIARRYLFSKKHVSLISTLTMVSVTGVTIGTALLIIVLSVFNGFFEVIKGMLLGNDPDIRIESAEGQPFVYTDSLQAQLEDIPQVVVASPYVSGKALLVYKKNRNQIVNVKGIHPESFTKLNKLHQKMVVGELNLKVKDQHPGLVMSQKLLIEMNLHADDIVALLSAEGMRKSLTQFSVPRSYRFQIRGADSVTAIIENPPVYVDLKAAQRLFENRNTVTGIDIRLTSSEQASAVETMLQSTLGEAYSISTWYELKKPLYDVMYMEKWGAYIILMIIVLVAVLNIVGSLTMIVIQKKRDIGVLLTLGYTPADIKKIFLKQGLYIGLIGCGIGGGLGLLLSWLQKQFGLVKLSSAFIIDAYPVSIQAFDVAIVLVASLVLCLLASWYPAKRAASVEPADAVRFE